MKDVERLTLNITEAAQALGISRPAMYTLIHREGFPSLKVGSRRLISRELLAEWVRAQASGQKETAPVLQHRDGKETTQDR